MSNQINEKKPEQISKEVDSNKNNTLILHNDNINNIYDVIVCLVLYCGHDSIQAEQCAWIAHYTGRCVIKSNTSDEILRLANVLQRNKLIVSIE
ncbi:MAG: ATP-dependent Clp protease adaptor ClpS [Dysgonamonadaceae bacterium]|nr:ATP-dependent Clp protease adaptor ClpS [Dysgonamonadaceae bacterium]